MTGKGPGIRRSALMWKAFEHCCYTPRQVSPVLKLPERMCRTTERCQCPKLPLSGPVLTLWFSDFAVGG